MTKRSVDHRNVPFPIPHPRVGCIVNPSWCPNLDAHLVSPSFQARNNSIENNTWKWNVSVIAHAKQLIKLVLVATISTKKIRKCSGEPDIGAIVRGHLMAAQWGFRPRAATSLSFLRKFHFHFFGAVLTGSSKINGKRYSQFGLGLGLLECTHRHWIIPNGFQCYQPPQQTRDIGKKSKALWALWGGWKSYDLAEFPWKPLISPYKASKAL